MKFVPYCVIKADKWSLIKTDDEETFTEVYFI